MRPGRLAAAVALILTLGCAACDSPGGSAAPRDGEATKLEIPPGVQPPESIAGDAAERVEKSLLTTLPGVAPVPLDPEYSDGIASTVCGNKRGPQAYDSDSGMRREWSGSGTRVFQFVGAFGAVTATQAIDQVAGVLGCGSYSDRDGQYTGVHKVTVRSARLAFCETVDGKTAFCTSLLARDDILVRVQVAAPDEATATKTLAGVTSQATQRLAKAW